MNLNVFRGQAGKGVCGNETDMCVCVWQGKTGRVRVGKKQRK